MTTASSDLVLHCDRISLTTAPLHSDMTGDSEHGYSEHDPFFCFSRSCIAILSDVSVHTVLHCDLV